MSQNNSRDTWSDMQDVIKFAWERIAKYGLNPDWCCHRSKRRNNCHTTDCKLVKFKRAVRDLTEDIEVARVQS